MSMTELLEELTKLTPDELATVKAKLDELTEGGWVDDSELSESDKAAIEEALADYEKNPDSGRPWEEVLAELRAGRK